MRPLHTFTDYIERISRCLSDSYMVLFSVFKICAAFTLLAKAIHENFLKSLTYSGNSIWLKYLKDDWSSKMSEKGLRAYLIQQRLFLLYIYFTNNLLILSMATTKALSNKRGYLQNPKCFTVRTWNPKIFNMISLVVGSMGQTTHRPSVWGSKH